MKDFFLMNITYHVNVYIRIYYFIAFKYSSKLISLLLKIYLNKCPDALLAKFLEEYAFMQLSVGFCVSPMVIN